MVSPLDFNRTAMNGNNQEDDFWTSFFNPAALFCGNLFNSED